VMGENKARLVAASGTKVVVAVYLLHETPRYQWVKRKTKEEAMTSGRVHQSQDPREINTFAAKPLTRGSTRDCPEPW